jgi:hypothetical protein
MHLNSKSYIIGESEIIYCTIITFIFGTCTATVSALAAISIIISFISFCITTVSATHIVLVEEII